MAKPQRTARQQPPSRTAPPAEDPRFGRPTLEAGYPGQRLGLPESGRGSVAPQSTKLVAFLVDLVLSGLVGFLAVRPHRADDFRLSNLVADGVFVVMTTLALMLGGRTPGMLLLGLQVIRLDGRTMGWRAFPRQVLCGLLIPAVVTDKDKRGLHDKPVGTVVVRVS